METAGTCEACGMVIEICEECGGKICSEGCEDRIEDGCSCDGEDDDDDE